MSVSPLAGKRAPAELLIDVDRLVAAYHDRRPDPANPRELVSFGTSGHRGAPEDGAFNEAHILAITQAILRAPGARRDHRAAVPRQDTHAARSRRCARRWRCWPRTASRRGSSADGAYTPTPALSRAILAYNNRGGRRGLADGIVITPSHNPPRDGGFKYNPPNGGPADSDVTDGIQARANELLRAGGATSGASPTSRRGARRPRTTTTSSRLRRGPARASSTSRPSRGARVKLGADPMGGASVQYWARIAERFGLDLTVVNTTVDPRFAFMPLDHDGKIRMDCSSPYAMATCSASRTASPSPSATTPTPTATAS